MLMTDDIGAAAEETVKGIGLQLRKGDLADEKRTKIKTTLLLPFSPRAILVTVVGAWARERGERGPLLGRHRAVASWVVVVGSRGGGERWQRHKRGAERRVRREKDAKDGKVSSGWRVVRGEERGGGERGTWSQVPTFWVVYVQYIRHR